ncbi:hypothetical protein ACSQ67_022081 [Phaseolus vulgaris]
MEIGSYGTEKAFFLIASGRFNRGKVYYFTILWGEALACSGRKPSDLAKTCFFLCFLRKFRQHGSVGGGGDVSQIYGPYGWLCCVSLSCCNEAPCLPGTAETGKMNQPLYESRA